jgi:septal ring factor EnvC (AmiA/AmiB activator)
MARAATAPLRALILALPLLAAAPAGAQAPEGDAAGKLQAIQGDLATAQGRRDALEAETARLASEARALQDRLVAEAAKAQAAAEAVTLVEQRLADLSIAAAGRSAELERREADLAQSLAALQLLARQPPAALLLRPGPPVDVMRSGLLLGAAVPSLSAEARQLGVDLAELKRLETRIQEDRTRLVAARDTLAASRGRLEALRDEKRKAEAASRADLAAERRKLARLAAEAQDLKALIAAAEKARAEREAAARAAAAEAERRAAEAASADAAARTAVAARLKAAVLVPPSARPEAPTIGGGLLPVRGQLVQRYGEARGEGLTSRGVRIRAAAGAEVVTPMAGQIVFAGPFKGYGQLLIVSAGEGYHLLLAGMERIDGGVGQRVVAGEPVGRMGAGGDGAVLYVELRRGGDPVDPLPWIGLGERKASG